MSQVRLKMRISTKNYTDKRNDKENAEIMQAWRRWILLYRICSYLSLQHRERERSFPLSLPISSHTYLYIHTNTLKLLYSNPASTVFIIQVTPPPPSASPCHHPQISTNHPPSTPDYFDTNCTLSRSNRLAVFSLLAPKFTLTLDSHWKALHISHIRQVSGTMW